MQSNSLSRKIALSDCAPELGGKHIVLRLCIKTFAFGFEIPIAVANICLLKTIWEGGGVNILIF